MANTKQKMLLTRLQQIANSIKNSPGGLALLGLGSVGIERSRLDEFSDLDFFVIVEQGRKTEFFQNLDWLSRIHPIAFCFANTADGYKLLFEDGIFCEFAIFEPQELAGIPYSPGAFVWKKEGVPEELSSPTVQSHKRGKSTTEWLVGEALTNLYVGLGRFRRGEKLSALKFVQIYAVDRLLDLLEERWDVAQNSERDGFDRERRLEKRFGEAEGILSSCCQGYEKTPESALEILRILQTLTEVNPAISREIRKLAIHQAVEN